MIKTLEIEYHDENTLCRGYLAYDSEQTQPRPCILIAPDWAGRGERACNKAKQIAALGYIGFALDMYGNAKLGNTKEECQALLQIVIEKRDNVSRRMIAGLTAACALPMVNSAKIAAIGYCFGGLCALDLARVGADIKGAVSFHGLLDAPEIATCKPIKAKILALHGYDDPLARPSDVNKFATEMTHKKADWQLHMYGNVKHAFTNLDANEPDMGLEYNATADRRSWESAQAFFREIFA